MSLRVWAGSQWEKAAEVFEQMRRRGCTPDVVSYTALISAYEKGGQWQRTLTAYDQMRLQNCKPDAIVYNAIIDALWETGVIWAQRKVGYPTSSFSNVTYGYSRRVLCPSLSTVHHCCCCCCCPVSLPVKPCVMLREGRRLSKHVFADSAAMKHSLLTYSEHFWQIWVPIFLASDLG